jgi:spore maturation protein CgeB
MKIVILGLSITSSWGNGHATTYRSLCRALAKRGHTISFWEKDVPWYRSARDLPNPGYCKAQLYEHWHATEPKILADTSDADAVVLGSYFGDGIKAADALLSSCPAPVLFYDIDTPITMAALESKGGCEYLRSDQLSGFSAYLSFSGGRVLERLESTFGAQEAIAFYCSVDTDAYRDTGKAKTPSCDLSYLGTYSPDRQEKLHRLLGLPAQELPNQEFVVAGSQYPQMKWPRNVTWIEHIPPPEHPAFYSSSRYTLNLTRLDMVHAGFSPSVRLFEAAACGAAIISDAWEGLDEFLTPDSEVLVVEQTQEVVEILSHVREAERRQMGAASRERILASHTSQHRAEQFERIVEALPNGTHSSLKRQKKSSSELTQYSGDSPPSSSREKMPVATAMAGK